MLRIRDIDDKKAFDIKHEEEKKQHRIALGIEPVAEEEKEDMKIAQQTMTSTMKSQGNKKKKMVEIDPEEIER